MLTERQLLLLQVLVDDYIRSAEPVGSRTIAKRDDIHYSPATIRNELADLEEMGFLEKTHSSSGRIPSEKGYRFYVDHLLAPVLLTAQETINIREAFTKKYFGLEKLIQVTAEMLSDFTNYTAIVMGPELLDSKLKHIQMIQINDDQAVMIVVTDTGHVENRMITLPPGISGQDIEKLVNILNEKLKMVPIYQLNHKIQHEVKNVLKEHIRNYEELVAAVEATLNVDSPDKIFYGGRTNILSQPEFRDIDKVLPLLNVLEKRDIIQDLLRSPSAGLHIKIGGENDLVAIKDCSVITTTYSVSGEHLGTVAVIGPTRMAYPRVVTLMTMMAKSLSEILSERD